VCRLQTVAARSASSAIISYLWRGNQRRLLFIVVNQCGRCCAIRERVCGTARPTFPCFNNAESGLGNRKGEMLAKSPLAVWRGRLRCDLYGVVDRCDSSASASHRSASSQSAVYRASALPAPAGNFSRHFAISGDTFRLTVIARPTHKTHTRRQSPIAQRGQTRVVPGLTDFFDLLIFLPSRSRSEMSLKGSISDE